MTTVQRIVGLVLFAIAAVIAHELPHTAAAEPGSGICITLPQTIDPKTYEKLKRDGTWTSQKLDDAITFALIRLADSQQKPAASIGPNDLRVGHVKSSVPALPKPLAGEKNPPTRLFPPPKDRELTLRDLAEAQASLRLPRYYEFAASNRYDNLTPNASYLLMYYRDDVLIGRVIFQADTKSLTLPTSDFDGKLKVSLKELRWEALLLNVLATKDKRSAVELASRYPAGSKITDETKRLLGAMRFVLMSDRPLSAQHPLFPSLKLTPKESIGLDTVDHGYRLMHPKPESVSERQSRDVVCMGLAAVVLANLDQDSTDRHERNHGWRQPNFEFKNLNQDPTDRVAEALLRAGAVSQKQTTNEVEASWNKMVSDAWNRIPMEVQDRAKRELEEEDLPPEERLRRASLRRGKAQ